MDADLGRDLAHVIGRLAVATEHNNQILHKMTGALANLQSAIREIEEGSPREEDPWGLWRNSDDEP